MSPTIASLMRQSQPQPQSRLQSQSRIPSTSLEVQDSAIVRTEPNRPRRRGGATSTGPGSSSSHRNRQPTAGPVSPSADGPSQARLQSQNQSAISTSSRSARNNTNPMPLSPTQQLTTQPQGSWTRDPPTPVPVPVYPPYDAALGSTLSMQAQTDPIKLEDEADSRHGSGFSIYCGFEDWDAEEVEPYEPSPFPPGWSDDIDDPYNHNYEYSSQTCNSDARSGHNSHYRRSTGCGALLHTSATPKPRTGTWHAEGRATESVVFMDKAYFEHGGQAKQFACGCRWSGVGCAQCGNPLGTIYIPCQAATPSSSSPSSSAPAPRQAPNQIQNGTYAHNTASPQTPRRSALASSINPFASARSSSSSHQRRANALKQQQLAQPSPVYTFFAKAVTSAPEFTFPPCCMKMTSHPSTGGVNINSSPSTGIDAGLVLPPPPPTQPMVQSQSPIQAYSYPPPSVMMSSSRRGPPAPIMPPPLPAVPPTNAPRYWTSSSTATLPSRLTATNATPASYPIPATPATSAPVPMPMRNPSPIPIPSNPNSNFRAALSDSTSVNTNSSTAAGISINIEAFSYETADALNGVPNDANDDNEENVDAETENIPISMNLGAGSSSGRQRQQQRNRSSEPGIMYDEDGVLISSRIGTGMGMGEPASPDKPGGEVGVMWAR